MEIFIKTTQLLLSLSILVIFHEAGHFFFAKLFKTRVEKFYLFFDAWFSLFKIKRGETEYGIGWIPLGGYVKISGMIDESMDKEQMKQPPQPHEFRSKKAWQRLLIMLGGVLVNVLLAMAIYIGVLFAWGEEYLPAENVKYGIMCDSLGHEIGFHDGDKILAIDNEKVTDFHQIIPNLLLDEAQSVQVERNGEKTDVKINQEDIAKIIKHGRPFFDARIPFIVEQFAKNSPAKEAGMQQGDKIIGLNGQEIQFFDQFKEKIQPFKNQEIQVTVLRHGQEKKLNITVNSDGLIGVMPQGNLKEFFEMEKIRYGFFASIPAGIKKGYNEISNYLKQFKLIFSPKTEAYKSVGSFIAIGNMFPGEWDWRFFWSMTALLSIMLAVINILPIPALDGGHVMFLLYEIIVGRKPGDKFMEYAQITGMILLLSLMVLALGNDVFRYILN